MSKIDPETRSALAQSVGLKRLMPLSADLDFYGSQICIRDGRMQLPGGPKAEAEWKELVGGDPQSPADFVPKLLTKDRGWLSAYYDSFARINQERQDWFVKNHRLKTFYAAFRGADVSGDAARPAFRLAPGLLLLMTRVQFDNDDHPLVPGGPAVTEVAPA